MAGNIRQKTTIDQFTARPAARGLTLSLSLAIAALLFGILSGIRWPNLWSATHLLFDYSNGFTKRGLVGEFISLIFGPAIPYGTLAAVSFCVLAVWVSLLFLHLRDLAKIDPRIWLIAAVVFISPGFVFLVHDVGYLEHFGLVAVFLCFMLPPNLAGLLGRMLLCLVMVITHEAFILMFFPVVALDFWMRARLTDYRHATVAVISLLAATTLLTYVMGQFTLPIEHEAGYANHIAERAQDFEIVDEAVSALFRTGGDNLDIMSEVWRLKVQLVWAALAAVFLLPLPIGLAAICFYIVHEANLARGAKTLAYLGVVVSAFCPLLLNIFAWDVWRFFALTQISAFLVLITVSMTFRPLPPLQKAWTWPAGQIVAALAVMGAATDVPLFDKYTATKPPYLKHINHLHDVWQGEERWMTIPKPIDQSETSEDSRRR